MLASDSQVTGKPNYYPSGADSEFIDVAWRTAADKAPIVAVLDDESTPVLYNDPALAARVKASLVASLGTGNVFDSEPLTGSEDVGVFGLEGHQIPVAFYWLGAMYPERFNAATAAGGFPPGMHTSRFEPDPEPTLRGGVTSLTAAAISLLR